MRIFIIFLIALFPAFAEAQGIFSRKKPEPTAAPRLPSNTAASGASAALQNGDILQLRLSGPPEEYTREFAIELSVDDGTITGVEALLRWHRPGHGLVSPDRFITVLEETGLILPVGAWVIRTACRQLAEWDR